MGVVALLVGSLLALPRAEAQAMAANGNKAVFGTGGVTFSKVWIDASAFWTSGVPDLCGIVNNILTSASYSQNYPNGAVIDARGLVHTGAPVQCNGQPFQGVTATSPSTILLPASTIPVGATWTLPNNTKIIGEGPNTILQAQNPLTGTTYMIEMGSSASCPAEGCSGVGIEHLELDASNNPSVNGIDNQYSQTPSYVNDVNLHQFSLTGLHIAGPGSGAPGAIDSGPYSNITYSTVVGSPCNSTACPVCVDIEAQTRGLHGITCDGSPQTGELGPQNNAGIYVNASNNSIEDVHVEAFWDGIEVGNTTSTVGNIVISNVNGSASQTMGQGQCIPQQGTNNCRVINTVHICGINHPQSSTFGECSNNNSGTVNTVSDVTILQAADLDNAPPTTSVQDDVTGTSITHCAGCQTTTAMYVVGEGIGGGYSRFASSPSPGNNTGNLSTVVPTWGVGTTPATTRSCTTPGALYSNTQGASGSAVLVCTKSSGTLTWQAIP